ncbi:MAG: transposase [Candidatus Blackburnbacteria bacterium]|nr:transposase [Candidatus Blackburnbacteria bacterium]
MQLQKDEKEYLLKELETKGKKLVNLICFVLMPNHFHALAQQSVNNGISTFIKRATDSYARYFNTKHERVGPLFQGAFKAVRITTVEQLLHVSRYIHLNPLVSFVVRQENFIQYQWSSLQYFLQENISQNIVDPTPILQNFSSKEEYKKFILDHAEYAKELEKIKHMVID